VRIERKAIESADELANLVGEVLEDEIEGLQVISKIVPSGDEIEIGMLVGDANGRLMIVGAREHDGDALVLSYGKHLTWFHGVRETLSQENPNFDWKHDPGLILMADGFSSHALYLIGMLGASPKACYSIKCLGMGSEKGLFAEPVKLPAVSLPGVEVREVDLLTKTVDRVVALASDLSVSASFGYVSESLDWVPVANVRKRGKTVWVDSGPGKWSTLRVEDDASLERAIEKVRASYKEVIKTRGEGTSGETELSEAERKTLKWE